MGTSIGIKARRPAGESRLVVALDGSGHLSDEVGGKGASLDVLVGRGFRVPPAAAVTTAAYRKFAASRGAPAPSYRR